MFFIYKIKIINVFITKYAGKFITIVFLVIMKREHTISIR